MSGTLVGLFVLIIGAITSFFFYQAQVQEDRVELNRTLNVVEKSVQRVINEAYLSTKLLTFTINEYGDVVNFEKTAESIAANNSVAKNLTLMRDGIISHVYPKEDREQYIGFNPFETEEKRIEAIKAIQIGTMYIAGPMLLETGEIGLVARNPVFIEDKFWGFTVTVFSLEVLIEQSGISSYSDIYYFQLSKENPNTGVEEFFLPEQDGLDLDTYRTINFPEGDWKLYVAALDNSKRRISTTLVLLFFIVASVTVGFLSIKVFRKPFELEELLFNKSHDLIISNEKYRQNSELLEKSLEEKTVLLAEVHHRVKNNLAIVSGLLELQKGEFEDEKLSSIFDRSINRIISIAMVHELMYKSKELSSISVNSYLKKLIPAISQTVQDPRINVTFEMDVDDYNLNINQAIPLGLLLNELITNSFKYAFNSSENNKITIKLFEENDNLKVLYQDNGRGFPQNIDFNSPVNLGLNLIHAQLQQLDATYEVDTDKQFKLEFQFTSTERGSHSNFNS